MASTTTIMAMWRSSVCCQAMYAGIRATDDRPIMYMEADYRGRTGVNALRIKHNGVLGYHIEVAAKHADDLMRPEAQGGSRASG